MQSQYSDDMLESLILALQRLRRGDVSRMTAPRAWRTGKR